MTPERISVIYRVDLAIEGLIIAHPSLPVRAIV
jgi:hypothetical protein